MHTNSKSDSYAAAGVDITAGYRAVELMKQHIAKTMTSGVCSDVGGFGGLFELDVTGMTRPVLVSGTDGVGTKLDIAFEMKKYDTVGIDCVAMCVNDVICVGAKPLFFLDYIACGKNFPERIADIVKGIDKEKPHKIIPDRKEAIAYAIDAAREGDIVLLAGKGHEEYEIKGRERRYFSEREIVAACLAARDGGDGV